MSLSVTAWRLADPAGAVAQCVIAERDGRWHLVVKTGNSIMIADRHPSDDAALARATQIWQALVQQGWREQRH